MISQPEFLPTTQAEMQALGWDTLDVLLVTGDAYVDSHSFGASLLGRWLVAHGFRTGIVAQPKWETTDDIVRMGRPRLFAGVTAGALDSLVAHYTAFRKKRSEDAYSPGGRTGLRPNRASIVYTGIVRQAFPGLPVIAGGVEASLRRASHYDFWSDALRRSIVLDSKADAVLYGMGERSIVAMAQMFDATPSRRRPNDALMAARIPGTAYAVHPDKVPADAEELPSHEAILDDAALLIKATQAFEKQMLHGGPCLVQRSGGRAVVFEPPSRPLDVTEMDEVYALPFTRRAHPSYEEPIPAVAMIEDSIVSHRGCAGGCSFCSIALHQGRAIQSRSEASINTEIAAMAARPEWKGVISDIGGPSANMWNARCVGDREKCGRESCVFPKRCRNFKPDQEGQTAMLRRIAARPEVNHLRVASGVRHDLAIESEIYMQALVGEFTGGQLKIAPEHVSEKILRGMRKPPLKIWETFLKSFDKLSREAGKEQYVIPYLMSGFPGCTDAEMEELAAWLKKRGWHPQQVQCFIPTPGTLATAMFYAKVDPDGRPIHVARSDGERLRQHRILMPEVGIPLPKREGEPAFRPRRPQRGFGQDRRGPRPDRRPPSPGRGGPGERRPRPTGPRDAAGQGGYGKPGGKPAFGKPSFGKPGFSKPGYSKPGGDKPGFRKPGDRPDSRRSGGGYNKQGGDKRGGFDRGGPRGNRRPGPRGGGNAP
ncbi:MAG: YgiQ family radical SAM protein [Planctomycetaceae bacterium]|nr:YgiQ family radical SAM protein [Planctomycetaceae bacterium]